MLMEANKNLTQIPILMLKDLFFGKVCREGLYSKETETSEFAQR